MNNKLALEAPKGWIWEKPWDCDESHLLRQGHYKFVCGRITLSLPEEVAKRIDWDQACESCREECIAMVCDADKRRKEGVR